MKTTKIQPGQVRIAHDRDRISIVRYLIISVAGDVVTYAYVDDFDQLQLGRIELMFFSWWEYTYYDSVTVIDPSVDLVVVEDHGGLIQSDHEGQ